jgi:hypothetical protein
VRDASSSGSVGDGIAVSGTMVITSIAFLDVTRRTARL